MAPKSTESIWTRPEQPARGPRPSFSRAQLTEAAIRVADAEGLDAISMRRMAAEIGSGTMSLYRYVSSKDDLIDLMSDAVAPEYFPPDVTVTGDWRADVRALAVRTRQTMHRHPWLAVLSVTRQSAGPNRVRLMESSLSLVADIGLSIDGMLNVVGSVAAYINGFVSAELAEAEALRRTGLDLGQWMARQGPFLQSLLQSGDYPLFTRMTVEGGRELTDPDERFAFGLDRLLDGIAAALPPAP
ncbi:TetR/AcrR family transcriptional regulator [Nonomuraea zeae]|uniref:TetR/AcrR family transcriptional regulator n=1 Tax=Nonomuraea zeae TaxID=1642303 RepID=A0A5S4GWG4_9ACTN|nr:TetR/AcrR family transcriptional regulator [Nonomuraea zeae]TMR36841.1 TetR/AcrR family transcriptional regulator [Nonomuraea zeae]